MPSDSHVTKLSNNLASYISVYVHKANPLIIIAFSEDLKTASCKVSFETILRMSF